MIKIHATIFICWINYHDLQTNHKKLPWPMLCHHCGNNESVEHPASLRAACPQCSVCRSQGKQPVETDKAVQNERAAKQARAKEQKLAAVQKANLAASKQKVPVRLAEWKFKQLVGCSKNHGGKIHWQTEDGEGCPRSHCTWQPIAKESVPGGPSIVQLDAQELQGASVSIEIAGKVNEATVHGEGDEGCSGANSTSYYLEYKRRLALVAVPR